MEDRITAKFYIYISVEKLCIDLFNVPTVASNQPMQVSPLSSINQSNLSCRPLQTCRIHIGTFLYSVWEGAEATKKIRNNFHGH
jgi:hypothetical protein